MGDWTRRGFLKALGIGGTATVAGAATLDPELLLWVPGAKTIFIPKEPVLYRGELVTDLKEVEDTLRYLSGNMLGPGGARYHMTLSQGQARDGKDLFFDDQWRLMQVVDAGRIVKLTEDKAKHYAAMAGIHPEQRSPIKMSVLHDRDQWVGLSHHEQTGWQTHDKRYHMEQVSLSGGEKTLTERVTRDRTWDEYWTDQRRIAGIRAEDLVEKEVLLGGVNKSGMVEVVRDNGMVEWVPEDSIDGLLTAWHESPAMGSEIERRLRNLGIILPSTDPDISD